MAFDELIFRRAPNLLAHLVPELARLDPMVRVIDVPAAADGQVLRILMNADYLRTGYRSAGLRDVQILTDDDIARQTSYAAKIGAVTDAARHLTLGRPAGGRLGRHHQERHPAALARQRSSWMCGDFAFM